MIAFGWIYLRMIENSGYIVVYIYYITMAFHMVYNHKLTRHQDSNFNVVQPESRYFSDFATQQTLGGTFYCLHQPIHRRSILFNVQLGYNGNIMELYETHWPYWQYKCIDLSYSWGELFFSGCSWPPKRWSQAAMAKKRCSRGSNKQFTCVFFLNRNTDIIRDDEIYANHTIYI